MEMLAAGIIPFDAGHPQRLASDILVDQVPRLECEGSERTRLFFNNLEVPLAELMWFVDGFEIVIRIQLEEGQNLRQWVGPLNVLHAPNERTSQIVFFNGTRRAMT